MDFTGFTGFPFPVGLVTDEDNHMQEFFYSLPEDRQLSLLNGSQSYEEFHERVATEMRKD